MAERDRVRRTDDPFDDTRYYVRAARATAKGLGHALRRFHPTPNNPRKLVSYCSRCAALVIVHPDEYTAPVGKAVAVACSAVKV